MTLKITPSSIESDGHVVLLPPGLTGEVTTKDGTTYDLGPAHQIAIEVDSHAHAGEVAIAASDLAVEAPNVDVTEHDAARSRKNIAAANKKG